MTRITLEQWAIQSGIQPQQSLSGIHPGPEQSVGTYIIIDHYNPYRKQLWLLSDYAVSSVAGSVVWMVPRMERVEV